MNTWIPETLPGNCHLRQRHSPLTHTPVWLKVVLKPLPAFGDFMATPATALMLYDVGTNSGCKKGGQCYAPIHLCLRIMHGNIHRVGMVDWKVGGRDQC